MMKPYSFVLAIAICIIVIPAFAQMDDPGEGTFKDPFALYHLADSGALIYVRVTDFERPADLDDDLGTPAEGQEYVIVWTYIECASSYREDCLVSSFDFTLAGDNGIVYGTAYGAILPETEGEVTIYLDPVGSRIMAWPFLVSSDDSNLVLLYYNYKSMPHAFPQVFATEAKVDANEPISIVPTIGFLTRVGPSNDLDFYGVLHHGESVPAHGRNADGNWLEIPGIGWAPAEYVEAEGDIMSLPVTSTFE